MAGVILFLTAGSTLLAFFVSWQVKVAGVDVWSVARYNLMILPLLFVANTFLGVGINRGHQMFEKLPLWVALQTAIYYLMITLFSIILLQNKISLGKTGIALALIIIAIYLLKS